MKKVVGLDVGLTGCGYDDKLKPSFSTQQQVAFFLSSFGEVSIKRWLSSVILLFLLVINFLIFPLMAQALPVEEQSAWPDIFQTNQGFALPFISPTNDPKVNLLLLIGMQNSLEGLFKQSFTESKNKQSDSPGDKIAQRLLESEFDVKKQQFPIEMIFDKTFVTQAYKDQKVNLTQRLQQFGVEYSKADNDLLSLNRFNQLVAADNQLDNAQKQLLIGLRASIFSYYHRNQIQQEKSLTSDEIIGSRIANLPDSDRIGEYKQYLIYLDSITNKELIASAPMPEFPSTLTLPWLRESANFLQLHYLGSLCLQRIDFLNRVELTEEAAKTEYGTLAQLRDDYHQAIARFITEFPDNPYLLEIYQNGCNEFDTSLLKVLFEPLILPHAFESQTETSQPNLNLLSAYEVADAFDVVRTLNHPTIVADAIAPHYEFLSALKLIADYEFAFESSKKMKKSEKAELLKSIANSRERLTQAGRNDLADFLLVNQTWYWDKNATKTTELIEVMNLNIESAHRSDQFAYWMMLSEAYKAKKQFEQAKAVLVRLQQFDAISRSLIIIQAASPEISRLLSTQSAYLQMRLNDLIVLVDINKINK